MIRLLVSITLLLLMACDNSEELKIAISDEENILMNEKKLENTTINNKEFKIQIVKPDPNIDYKLLKIEPDSTINFKILIIDPDNNLKFSISKELEKELQDLIIKNENEK